MKTGNQALCTDVTLSKASTMLLGWLGYTKSWLLYKIISHVAV